jgi:hypothetical protein
MVAAAVGQRPTKAVVEEPWRDLDAFELVGAAAPTVSQTAMAFQLPQVTAQLVPSPGVGESRNASRTAL